jgi:hypothetical protein
VYLGEELFSGGNSQCKIPTVRECLMCSGNIKEQLRLQKEGTADFKGILVFILIQMSPLKGYNHNSNIT